MKSMIQINKINFGSFAKLWLFISFPLGITMGLFLFLLSLLGGNVYANMGSIHLTGVQAGIANIFLIPASMALSSIVFSLMAYWPFKWINQYILKGLRLKGEFILMEEALDKDHHDPI